MPNAETKSFKHWDIEDWLKVARYEGPVDGHKDFDRLQGQTRDIYNLMSDGVYRTLAEIEKVTGYPEASISAQLRHLRKLRFGGHTVKKQRRFEDKGLWEYQLIPRTNN
ncbi:MAG: hypothetical protein CVU62_13350 [Deltaproteobacteria bacterium HGW-Deltaproteobacteria-2]|jgi:hypothetical protein|nr:MAG: hypothetical protein CVU62_13350 [Deltaproteobacteria bacterium HGW-Deltaproteobacteria-2]